MKWVLENCIYGNDPHAGIKSFGGLRILRPTGIVFGAVIAVFLGLVAAGGGPCAAMRGAHAFGLMVIVLAPGFFPVISFGLIAGDVIAAEAAAVLQPSFDMTLAVLQ